MDLAEGHWAATKKILEDVGCKGQQRSARIDFSFLIRGQRPVLNDISGWLAYNLGLGRGYSVLEVVDCFKSVSGRPIPVDFVGRRDGDVASSYSDCTLASSQLDWTASRSLTDMCKDSYMTISIFVRHRISFTRRSKSIIINQAATNTILDGRIRLLIYRFFSSRGCQNCKPTSSLWWRADLPPTCLSGNCFNSQFSD